MLAAYRVYGKGEALAAVAAATKLDENATRPLGGIPQDATRPELAKWRAATDANRERDRGRISGRVSPQRLSIRSGSELVEAGAGQFSECGQDRRSASPHECGEEIRSSSPSGRMAARCIAPRQSRWLLSRAEKAKQAADAAGAGGRDGKDASHQGSPHGVRRERGRQPWTRRSSFAATITTWASRWSERSRRFCSLSAPAPEVKTKSGRLELADWIVDPRNPLPSRVMANRIWQGHFGDGIVRTPDNFGRLGERPSNPELLDYLAKTLHREWLVHQEDEPHDHALEDLPDERRRTTRRPKRRIRRTACSRTFRGSASASRRSATPISRWAAISI